MTINPRIDAPTRHAVVRLSEIKEKVQAVVLGIAKSGSLFILYTAFPSYPFLARADFVYWLRIGIVDIFILK